MASRIVRSLVAASAACLALAALGGLQETRPEPPASQPDDASSAVYVHLATSMGDILFQLDPAKAPISVENFMGYVETEFYDGTIFHRVIPGFMIQGGGFTERMTGGVPVPALEKKQTGAPIRNESDNGLSNERGTVAMARTNVVDSATSQFYINVADNSRALDGGGMKGNRGYAVFGKVVAGMDVADRIAAVERGPRDVPVEAVLIEQVREVTAEKAEAMIEAEASAG